ARKPLHDFHVTELLGDLARLDAHHIDTTHRFIAHAICPELHYAVPRDNNFFEGVFPGRTRIRETGSPGGAKRIAADNSRPVRTGSSRLEYTAFRYQRQHR